MTDQPLILAPLKRAVARLAEALAAPDSGFVRDSIVKRFEDAYELSLKFMRRHLIWAALEPEPQTRKDLFRAAARAGLIDDPEAWFAFHDARNLTAHAYNDANAAKVIGAARHLMPAARSLLEALETHHAA
jgi:nucleotidyltransferase substrate binding protein (TIGR01987 family)